ncbi:hypothetical protein GGR28_003081 [Lewinella aquimaris]|uniref:Uncharacterized protein n=1 Tax=Neolewinella aquimaris TaxID=1835722 RepID=A0A840EAJ4_9BACT|nr:hypothetical protein [Neolewinella aquimaris]MBB4080447.1 hypothetical protein [Neolewinella aquimaris]
MKTPSTNEKENTELYESIVERLGSTDLDSGLLKESSKLIAQAYGNGIKWDDVFPYGIKRPDGITARGRVSIDEFTKVKDLLSNRLLRRLDIFPIGIRWPDYLDVHAHFSKGRAPRIG